MPQGQLSGTTPDQKWVTDGNREQGNRKWVTHGNQVKSREERNLGEPEWLDFPIMTMTEYEPAKTVISCVIKDNPR